MIPVGFSPQYPKPTTMEEMVLARVQPIFTVYRSGEFGSKFWAHVCCYAQDTRNFVLQLPTIPLNCPVVRIMRPGEETQFPCLKIRRHLVEHYLHRLIKERTPGYRMGDDFNVDVVSMNNLPEAEIRTIFLPDTKRNNINTPNQKCPRILFQKIRWPTRDYSR